MVRDFESGSGGRAVGCEIGLRCEEEGRGGGSERGLGGRFLRGARVSREETDTLSTDVDGTGEDVEWREAEEESFQANGL